MVFKKILVVNKEEYLTRRRLFESLGSTYKIRFSFEYNINEVDGIILFNEQITKKYKKPALFYFQDGEPYVIKKNITFKNANLDGINYSNKVIYTDTIILSNALRNFNMSEIIAEQDNMIIWARKEYAGIKHYYSVIAPRELLDYESLKHLFFCNDIISTLPLLVFIREIIKSNNQVPVYKYQKPAELEAPLLEKIYDSDILFSRTRENTMQAGISAITMDIISEQRLNPVRYFDKE